MQMVHFIPPSQRRLAMLAAQADTAPVLISGASGTGKGAIARWIHANGPRGAKPIIEAHFEKSLAEQVRDAQGGTFVIHEIGEWPLREQKVLLSFLQTRSILNPDTKIPMLLNVRIIATTSQTLEGRAQAGLFNPELLEKLNVFRLEMPPLCKRTAEFEDIVVGIVREIARELRKEHVRGLSPEAWLSLKSYDWPGNLRELRNVLRMSLVHCKTDRIETSDLPEFGHDRIDFRATREQFEKVYMQELLRTFGGRIDKICEVARIDQGTLLSKLNQYGIKFDLKPVTSPSPPTQ